MKEEEVVVAVSAFFFVFGLPFLGLMIWLVTHYLYAAFRTWHETALKRDMVARGYSVAEIVEVVGSKRGSCGKNKTRLSDVPPAKPIRQPAYST
jgi:hypothetical protein